MRIVITGGHPGPALAVIDHIRSSYPNWKIYFVGTKNPLTDDKALSFEYKEIAARGLPFINLNTGKFDRANKLKLILNSYKIARGYFKSLTILNRIKPDAVLAFGGYLAVPVAFGAKTLGIKVLTHEQTFGVGFANRLIANPTPKVCSWVRTLIPSVFAPNATGTAKYPPKANTASGFILLRIVRLLKYPRAILYEFNINFNLFARSNFPVFKLIKGRPLAAISLYSNDKALSSVKGFLVPTKYIF